MTDWLALPGDEPAVSPEKFEPVDPMMPAVSETALVVAKRRSEEREAYTRAWNALTQRQQVFLRALQQTGFSTARARKVLNEVIHLDGSPATRKKLRISDACVHRWARQDADYRLVLAALKSETVVQVSSRDDLLLRAHRAAEYAEDEQPILHQGQDTGFRERNVGDMLRANEQLMKATKVLGSDDNRVQVAIGPALIVQVVQGDGSVKDVTPRGVVVDLPLPA